MNVDRMIFENFLDEIILEDTFDITMESMDEDIVFEGANLDSRKKYKACVKKHRKIFKEIKTEVKNKNYGKAKKLLKDAEKNLDDCIKIVKTYKEVSGVGSFIFSLFVGNIPTLGRSILLSLVPFVGYRAARIINGIENISGIVRSVIENKDKVTVSDFNVYQNKLITKLMTLKKVLKKYELLIKEAEKEDNKASE